MNLINFFSVVKPGAIQSLRDWNASRNNPSGRTVRLAQPQPLIQPERPQPLVKPDPELANAREKLKDGFNALLRFVGTKGKDLGVRSLFDAGSIAMGKSLRVAHRPEEAFDLVSEVMTQLPAIKEKIKSTTPGSGRPQDLLDTVKALEVLLTAQRRYAEQLVDSSPFNMQQIAKTRSLYWRAAENMVKDKNPDAAKQFAARAAFLARASGDAKSQEVSSDPSLDRSDRKERELEFESAVPPTDASKKPKKIDSDPASVARRGVKKKAVKIAGRKVKLADMTFFKSGQLRQCKELQENVEAVVKRERLDERALAQSNVAAALEAQDQAMPNKQLKDRFRIEFNEVLKSQDNPKIENRFPIPIQVPAVHDGKLGEGFENSLATVVCEQTPAKDLTSSMRESYGRDGIQGVNCHDDMQHLHALNMYRSSFKDGQGNELLTVIRHGVHSAHSLTPDNINSLTDRELGKIALDLAEESGDETLKSIRTKWDELEPQKKSGIETKGSDTGDEASETPQDAYEVLYEKAGAYVRNETLRYAGVSRRLDELTGESLIDRLRASANRNRALESAEAAFTCLPDAELVRMLDSKSGAVPVLRLSSVSMLTPDAFRGLYKGATHDERLMWRDQQAAWKAVSEGTVIIQVPKIENGKVVLDLERRPQTEAREVQLDVAIFNIPVNAGGADSVAGDFSFMVDNSHEANQAATEKLLGRLPANPAHLKEWVPNGWVGEALSRIESAIAQSGAGAAVDALKDLREKQHILRELSHQIASMHVADPMVEGRLREADPYRLVKRLLVLTHETGTVASLLNCRSGKDRTTEGETQTRQFTLEIHTTGEVPPTDKPPGVDNELQRLQLWGLLQGGGSREIQRQNTGSAGNKIKDEAMTTSYGSDPESILQYRGMSAHVGT